MHFMKTKTKGRLGNVALKFDISKDFDGMDCDYLRRVMMKMGFLTQRISWIILFEETIDYFVLVNDDVVGSIHPSKGLKKVDPLSS